MSRKQKPLTDTFLLVRGLSVLVGDTGFEPVTSSVSAKIRPRMAAALSAVSVRLSTCLIGPGRTNW
jgi:hypothetical protein